jgi:hypothetical protein
MRVITIARLIVMDIIKDRDAVLSNRTSGLQQGESSQVNIRGNNNHVNINQAQNVQNGGGSDGTLV